MSTLSNAATRKANKATADDLAVAVPPTCVACDKSFSLSVKATSDTCDDERAQIWRIYEENMHDLCRASSFGWDPQKKRKELFHPLSRFVIARSASDDPASSGIVAYSTFRFEREDRRDVVYCYELQVSTESRRFGLGRLLIQLLADIGVRWSMTGVMLTVLKANHAAMLFYESVGFTVDETSPDFSNDAGGGTEDEHYDYRILSRRIP